MFTNINRLASETEEKSGLVVVLIDEIDKLVPCRQKIGNKNEPQDTIRVSNVPRLRPTQFAKLL